MKRGAPQHAEAMCLRCGIKHTFLAYVFSSVIHGIRDIFLEIGVSDLFLRTLFDQEGVSSLSSLTHYERQLNRLRRLNMRAEKLSSVNTALSCVFVCHSASIVSGRDRWSG